MQRELKSLDIFLTQDNEKKIASLRWATDDGDRQWKKAMATVDEDRWAMVKDDVMGDGDR